MKCKVVMIILTVVTIILPLSVSAETTSPELSLASDIKNPEEYFINHGGNHDIDPESSIDWKLIVGADTLVSPSYMCINCNWFCYTVCAAEAKFDSSWYHNTLLTKDCKVTLLTSRGAMMCPTCLKVWEQYGYHQCWEVHTKCSKGQYDVCPMQIS